MELQKLRYFYTIAKFQHMTKAAEYMNIAQPALSQAIKSLEQELGVELFSKKGRNIVLTPYGEYLKTRLDTILPDIDSISTEIDRMKKRVCKTVRLNILAASAFVINTIVEYRQNHPDTVFDFEQNVQKFDCDIVITTNGQNRTVPNPSVKKSVCKERIYVAVPSSSLYAEQQEISLAELRDEEFVMLSSARLFGAICNGFCHDAGFYPKILFESDSPTAVQNIVSTGTGVAFWPEFSWGEPVSSSVSLVPLKSPDCSRDIIVKLYENFPRSEYAEDFYNFLVQKLNDAKK